MDDAPMTYFEKLRISFAWQWRWAIVGTNLRGYAWFILDAVLDVIVGLIRIACIPIYPIRFAWRYTIGLFVCAYSMTDEQAKQIKRIVDTGGIREPK